MNERETNTKLVGVGVKEEEGEEEEFQPWLRTLKDSVYEMKKSPATLAGLSLVVFFSILALIGPLIAPHSLTKFLASFREPPSKEFPFGTDKFGVGLLSRILYSLRLDLGLSLVVVFSAVVIGMLVGGVAGYYGGIIDEALMRVTEIFLSFPGLILAMAVMQVFGAGGFDVIMYSLIVVWWPPYARLVRGNILSEKEGLYVEAAQALGLSRFKILYRHILPNVLGPVIILATMDLGAVLLTAAGLAFLGLGAGPGAPELGLMISEGRRWITVVPGYVFFPGFTIFLIVLGWNLLGDGLRDIFNPRIRRGRG